MIDDTAHAYGEALTVQDRPLRVTAAINNIVAEKSV